MLRTSGIKNNMKKICLCPESRSVTKRIAREKKTIGIMIGMYCNRCHGRKKYLCHECQQLLDYAEKRLDQCPFRDEKPACANCAVHCYKPDMRQKVREVMRYSGPRMVYRHPVLASYHLIDRRHKQKEVSKDDRRT